MKLTTFLFVLSCASFMESFPADQERSIKLPPRVVNFFQNKTINNEFEKPLTRKINDQIKLDDTELNYRLPNHSVPTRYDLWLKTDVDKEIFEFSGRVKIRIKILISTSEIVLHHRQLKIDKIDSLDVTNTLDESNLDFDYDSRVEFLTVFLPRRAVISEVLVLDISYHGTLRSDSAGFYRSSYQKNDVFGDDVWYATTQFEPTDARHVMPCFDEPGIRAIINVQIQHDKSYHAISNMPIESREDVPGTDYVTTKFEDTRKMQTYLLAFVISDFNFVNSNEAGLPQRVFAKPQSIARGDADFAASVVSPILNKFQNYFSIQYPLPKMDHAAITDYISNAMENFGLITYKEENILYNPEISPNKAKEIEIIEIITHEFAHQYFGNIVGLKWWSYTWLNEGFATLYQYFISNLLFPENNHMEKFLDLVVPLAFLTDTKEYKTVPMNYHIESPQEISLKFNEVSYEKAACVLRMFQEALTVEVFTEGVINYLNDKFYDSASPEDLHWNLQKAWRKNFPDKIFIIADAMMTWEDQAGYPIVHVERLGTKFKFTQKRFDGGDEIYAIPLSYTTNSTLDFTTKTPKTWMTTKSIEIEAFSDLWLIPNIQQTGYYKVSYDKNVWTSLISLITFDHELFPPVHRRQFFIDISSQLELSSIEAFFGLYLMSFLDRENVFKVWQKASVVENFFSEKLFGTKALEKYQEIISSLTQPQIDRLGISPYPGEPENDAKLRVFVLKLSCKAFNQQCLTYQYNLLRGFVESGRGSYQVCEGMRLADEKIYEFVLESALDNPDTRYEYLYDLGCSLNEKILERFLKISLDLTNNLESFERVEIIEKTAGKSVIALEVAMKFIKENLNEIEEKIPNSFVIILQTLAKSINSPEHNESFKEVLKLISDANFLSEAETEAIASIVERNLNWIDKNLHEIVLYLDGETPTESTPTQTNPTDSTPTGTPSTTETSETTTLAGSSLTASFTAIVLCALMKSFA